MADQQETIEAACRAEGMQIANEILGVVQGHGEYAALDALTNVLVSLAVAGGFPLRAILAGVSAAYVSHAKDGRSPFDLQTAREA